MTSEVARLDMCHYEMDNTGKETKRTVTKMDIKVTESGRHISRWTLMSKWTFVLLQRNECQDARKLN